MANIFVLLLGIIQDRRNRLRVQRRMLRDATDPFTIPEVRFQQLFRFSKEGARELLQELSPHMKSGVRRTYVPNSWRMCAALHYYATGSLLADCGQDFNCPLSKTMMSRIVHEVSYIIQDKLSPKYIRFPTTLERQNEVKSRFYEVSGFPGIIGAIDCTYVKIKKPSMEVEHCYMNQKGFHCKNVQLICDFDLEIFNSLARYGGSSEDDYIWCVSRIRAFLEEQSEQNSETWLVGDSNYPLEPWLMTPINPPTSMSEQKYNDAHIMARNCVERLARVLKKVFGCLSCDRGLLVDPAFSGCIINACCTLHNIRRKYNLVTHESDNNTETVTEEGGELLDLDTSNLERGRACQESIVRNYFSI